VLWREFTHCKTSDELRFAVYFSDQVGAFADMQILHQRLFRVTDREFYVGWVRLCPTEEPAFQEAFELLHKRAAVLRSRRPMSDC